MDTTKNRNVQKEIAEAERKYQTIQNDWLYCFQAMVFALNSPEAIGVPLNICLILEVAKKKLETIMAYYEEDSIKEKETRV